MPEKHSHTGYLYNYIGTYDDGDALCENDIIITNNVEADEQRCCANDVRE